MNRSSLCLTGALLLSSGAIGWLWRDNQALREQIAHEAPQIATEAGEVGEAKVLQIADGKTDAAPDRRNAPGSATPRLPRPRLGQGLQPVRAGKEPSSESGKRKEAGELKAPVANADKEADTDKRAALLMVVSAVEGEKDGASLFKNGGFETGLAPWLCKEGKVIQEPGNSANSILEITPSEEKYSLRQTFQRKVSTPHQLLTFRVKAEGEDLSDIKVALVGKDGAAIPIYMSVLGKAGKWIDISIPFDLGPKDFQPAGMTIEGGSTKTALWIDDVVLREVSSSLVGVQK
ncbi:hypothetical protein [Luteolibacter sp. Populi]|uniref:hypothetical protein n=1 Tax=Luteolibacter sp. Populi TaxID=3230487 RepID=UPI0034671A40